MPPACCRSRTGRPTGSSAGPAAPRASAGMCWRSGTRRCAEVWPGCAARGRSRRTNSAVPRRAVRGGTGRRPRSPPSGCSTSASWSAASGGASRASTTWPSAPSRPSCWPRNGATRSAPRRLVVAAGRSLGVATEADLAVYHGLPRALVRRVLSSSALTEVAVRGMEAGRLRRSGCALESLGTRARGRNVLLSPFDSLIWYRDRARASLRSAPPAGGLHAEGEAHLRVLRHAGARRHPDRRSGRPRPARRCPRGQAGHAAAPGAAPHVARALVRRRRGSAVRSATSERVEPASARAELEAELPSARRLPAVELGVRLSAERRAAIFSKVVDIAAVRSRLGRVVQRRTGRSPSSA